MLAHVIHNLDRQDRTAILTKELSIQKIEMRIWSPIFDITPATGIAKAHKQIVQWAKDNNQEEVLIMEDDVRFCGEGAFEYFLDNKPKDFDLYLAGIYYGVIKDDNTVDKFSALHCYIIHSRFYDSFLSCPDKKHIDYHLSGLNSVYKVCNPFAAIQYNGYSDNVKKSMNYDNLLKNYTFYNNYTL